MKYAASTLMVMIMMLIGSAVWAACPETCPGTCPEPVQCPKTCCEASIPAAIGMGPQGDLMGIGCPDFDPAYIKRVFQQNATIIAVTEYGMQQAANRNLQNISYEINGRLVSANQKLISAYAGCGCLTADKSQADAIIAELCGITGNCFDVTYAKTLSALLRQSKDADDLAITKAGDLRLQQQAQFMSGKENDWVFRLDRWVTDHGY